MENHVLASGLLTHKQRRALAALANGLSVAESAHSMGIRERSLEDLIRRARMRLGCRTKTAAVAEAIYYQEIMKNGDGTFVASLLLRTTNHQNFYQMADDAFLEFGYHHMIYAAAAQSGLPFFETRHSTTPESWRRYYEAEEFYYDDPVVAAFLTAKSPFLWSTLSRRGRGKKIMDEAAAAGLTCGLTIPIRGDIDGLATLSLSGRQTDPSAKEIQKLECLALELNALYHRIKPQDDRTARLTRREIEVLQYAFQEMTDAQIATKLEISTLTVNDHMRSIRGKLGVATRTGAVMTAFLGNKIIREPAKTP